ncbi:unnamed protein product [Moneuplotes crassus]|uniref:NADP-dependent oxidoreductase domain-containing protein n=1 Tax=Euplotes crassus TaxID=5936 RepID=A0AAD1UGJ8_EUPCR|nr:unnamed protein product [Moneuplotes crassus]
MEQQKPKMIYRKLGNTGLDVSVLSFGTWLTAHDDKAEDDIIECMKKAWELGVNFFDTAEGYGAGVAETLLGKGLKAIGAPREDFVVSTKLFICGSGVNDKMLSRKHLVEGVKNSLKRLDLDYVDVIFCHRPDTQTPIDETCRAMDWIVEEGYAFYWATSEWTPDQIARAMEVCEKEDLNKPIADQCQYNGFYRENFEKNLRHSYENYKYGTTVWSPLAMGLLTGKYNSGEFPVGSRFHPDSEESKFDHWYFGKDVCCLGYEDEYYISNVNLLSSRRESALETCNKFTKIAEEVGCTSAQLGLAWVIVNRDTSTCIFGAKTPQQVEDNIGALKVASKWTEELEDKIEEALGNQPDPEMDYNTWAPKRPRRRVAIDYNMPNLNE